MDELAKDHSSTVFSEEELELGFVATAILFFFAGFDTTSTTLSVVVHALVHHPHIQERLRKEIEEVIGDSEEVTADHLKELKYIENIIFEAMRKYFSFGNISSIIEPLYLQLIFRYFPCLYQRLQAAWNRYCDPQRSCCDCQTERGGMFS